ncbi:unnamed protein product [Prorocentrum cordatum]|uniref:Peptidase A1 domain-containing protein n=1 Tax=Prorocentrum cordatum TaxID=2364126 RepID=A0ABN9Q032_9DINO|nr:unnamed protein product [Polarella glacialis]
MSSQCEPCEALPGVATYDSASSSTFADGGGGARVHEYGSGPVLARQDVETACIGGEGDEVSLCAQRVPFWQVLDHNLSVWEGDVTAFSAIVGLGHPRSLEDVQAAGASSDSLLERLGVERFGVCLQPGPGAPGWLDVSPPLGPHFTEVPVVGTAYWAVTLTGIALGDVGADLCSPSCGALVDTGFSLIGAPAAAIAALSPVLGSIAEDCSNLLELPTLQFRLGGALFELPPSAYVLEPRHLGVCAPAFMEVDMVSQFGPAWIFGLPFFRRYYTVFDRTGPRLHVAHAGLGCRPAPHYLATAGSRGCRCPSSPCPEKSEPGRRRPGARPARCAPL